MTISPKANKDRYWHLSAIYIGLVIFYTIARFFFDRGWLSEGEMYAEMATTYFHLIHSHVSLSQLFFGLDAGYIPLPQRLIAVVALALKLNAQQIPYLFNWTAVILLPATLGIFVLKPFRSVVAEDIARIVLVMMLLLTLDFETKTFVNFTYGSIFSVMALSVLALQDPPNLPKWSFAFLIFGLSKPYMFAVAPIMAWVLIKHHTRKTQIFAALFIGLLVIQAITLFIHQSLVMPITARHTFHCGDWLMAVTAYFFILLGHFSVGPVFDRYLSAAGATWFYITAGIGMMFAVALTLARKKQIWLLTAGISLILTTLILNCSFLSVDWNIDLQYASFLMIHRHTVPIFFGCLLLIVGLLNAWKSVLVKLTNRFIPTDLLMSITLCLWFLASGWFGTTINLCRPPGFPSTDASDWHAQSQSVLDTAETVIIPINPYGWYYSNRWGGQMHFPTLTNHVTPFSSQTEIATDIPRYNNVYSAGIVVTPLPSQVGQELSTQFIFETKTGRQTLTSTRTVRGTTLMMVHTLNPVKAIQHVSVILSHTAFIMTHEADSTAKLIYGGTEN